MIDAQYKRDFHGHYLIINSEIENINYSLKMLLNNKIKGLLNLELHIVDNTNQFYYDITSKESLTQALAKNTLNYEQVKKIMVNTINAIELGKDYLLSEDDFVLDPDYLFINLTTYEINICYLVGYQKDIISQLSRMIEYLMNKVDYKDEQGVLFIYGLYKISKEECPTFDRLISFINEKFYKNDSNIKMNHKYDIEKISADNKKLDEDKDTLSRYNTDMLIDHNSNKDKMKKIIKPKDRNKKVINKEPIIPVMDERLESEEEILVYSKKTIIYVILSIVFFILLIITGYELGVYFNKFNDKLDVTKMFGCILVLGTLEIYILSKLLNKKNRIPKIKQKIEYINNVIDYEKNYSWEKVGFNNNKENKKEMQLISCKNNKCNEKYGEFNDNRTELLDNYDTDKTNLLVDEEPVFILKSLNPFEYKDIELIEFPFFIGKLNKQIDELTKCNTISRYHAKIEQKGEDFYITDLESTNGTYLNSKRLRANESRKLQLFDEIKFANIIFQFELK